MDISCGSDHSIGNQKQKGGLLRRLLYDHLFNADSNDDED